MRLFFTVFYNFKKTIKLSEILSDVRKIMEENDWEQERILFDFQDVNDASSESRTPHHMMIKAFPQMAAYWKSAYQRWLDAHPYQKDKPNPFQHSYFSNFPGQKGDKLVFCQPDDALDLDLMQEIFAKIPKPYSFYSSALILDGIRWYDGCDTTPVRSWGECGFFNSGEWEAGESWGLYFGEIYPFYQSNSIRIGKEFFMGPELSIQIEIFSGKGLEKAEKISEAFASQFGPPIKRYVKAAHAWEERETYDARIEEMRIFFDEWRKQIREESEAAFQDQKEAAKEGEAITFSRKIVSRKTLQNNFIEVNGLHGYPFAKWDNRQQWCKTLEHNYHLNVGFNLGTEPPTEDMMKKQQGNKLTNNMSIHCYGSNFYIVHGLSVLDFWTPQSDVAGKLAFHLFQNYLNRFEAEVVPELFRIFGETPAEFRQDSWNYPPASQTFKNVEGYEYKCIGEQ